MQLDSIAKPLGTHRRWKLDADLLFGRSLRNRCARSWRSLCLAIASLAACGGGVSADDAAPPKAVGISTSKPESGPFVDLKDGTYMVPYTQTIENTDVLFEMIPIPGGEFVMGSPESEPGRTDDEGPQFTVVLPPFWMAKTELTWAEYKTFMKTYDIFKRLSRQGIRKVTTLDDTDAITVPTPLYEPSHTFEYGDDKQQPAVTMTQYAAKQYTKWLSGLTAIEYRLPTEAEWEYAARAGASTPYSFGADASQLGDYAAYSENASTGAPKVGSKKPNAFGLHDMHGSVWEWTIDQYSTEGYGDRAGKKLAWFDAIGLPQNKEMRCVRGGGWQDPPERLRSAARMGSADEVWKDSDPNVPLSPWWYTSDPARMVGMRLVRSYAPLNLEQRRLFWDVDHPEIKEDVDFRLKEGRGVLGKSVPELSEEYKRKR